MASIQGVKVTGIIVPGDTQDTYPVIDPIYGIDGLRNLSGGTSALSGITSDRRRAGMLVGVNNGASYYKLNPAPWYNTISDWTPFSLGSTFTGGTVTGATIFTDGLTADTFSLSSTPAINTTNSNVLTLNQSTGVVEQRSINSLINVINLVTVGLTGSSGVDYYTIKEAVDSITDASSTNTYVVKVGPGVFNEDPITMKSYVDVIGESETNTIIQAKNANTSLIIGADQSMVSDVQIQGCTGTSVAAVVYSSPTTPQLNAIFYVENVRFGANYTHAKTVGTSGGNCIMQCSNVKYGGYPFTLGFYVTNDGSGIGRMQLRNVTSTNGGVTTTSGLIFAKADQPGCAFIVNGCLLTKATGSAAGTGFWVENGGSLRLTGVNFQRWETGIYAPQIGSAPSIEAIALNFENCTTDVNIIHSGATGKIQGTDNYLKTLINIDAPLYEVNEDPRIITVGKKGNNFTSIKDAIDSITNSSTTNRYVVKVAPGRYVENEIILKGKEFISVVGEDILQVLVVAANPTQNIFTLGNNNELSFMTLSGASNGVALSCVDMDGFSLAHKISIYDCDTNVLIKAENADSTFYGEYMDFNGEYSYGSRVLGLNGLNAYGNFENYYNYPTGTGICIGNSIQGSGATLSVFVADGIGNGVSGSTNYQLADYASLNTISTTANNWGYGIRVLNNGGPSRFDVDSYSVVDSMVYDLSVEQLSATGTFGGGSSSHSKIYNVSDNVYWAFLDTNDGEFEVTRKISVTFTDGTHTDMSTLIFQGGTMGLIHGGVVTSGTGLTVDVSTGYGYVERVADANIIKRIDWDDTSISLLANSSLYLFFNESGALFSSGSRPAMKNNIILGRVVTNSTSVEFIDLSPMNAEHTSNRFANLFREAIGPLYAFGSIVTENATPFKLNITAGEYYYSTNEYIPSGATGSTFTQYYNNGSGGWNTSATTFVNNTQFDNNGVLSGLTSSAFTKHTLYIVGDGIYEKYFLVLGQKQYNTLIECENALLPTPPTFFNDSVAQVANIYIKQGISNILQIEDIRPVIGFKAGGVNASSLHANLLGLTSDDHKQYLLGDGSRAMSGTLKMGNNPIISAGTINNVTIESHAARHKHGGADEIATVTPSGSAIPKADANGKLDTWISNASSTITGTTKLSVNPAVATNPIAVGVNDQRFLQAITGVTTLDRTNIFRNVSGGTTTINDVRVTGGTYNSGTGTATFRNSVGSTFDVTGYFKPSDDIYVDGGYIDHSSNIIYLSRSNDAGYVGIGDIITVIEITIENILTLIANNGLIKGMTYKITDCDKVILEAYVNGEAGEHTTIYLKAIETGALADTGVGLFYTPKYMDYEIWSNLSFLNISYIISGEFIADEPISGDDGSIGNLFGDVNSGFFITDSIYTWGGDTIITGQLSGAQAMISSIAIKNYKKDAFIIWGGYVWECTDDFNVGAADNIFQLNTKDYPIKQVLPLSKLEKYNISYDEIKYDIDKDRIIYRKDKNNNIVSTSKDNITKWEGVSLYSPIRAFKWGDDYEYTKKGIGNQKIYNSYNENINFRGESQYNIEMVNDSYQHNMFFENVAKQYDIFLSSSYQTNVKLISSNQNNINLIDNSFQNNICIISGYQNNIKLSNTSSQTGYYINGGQQYRVTLNNASYQSNITSTSNQYDMTFDNASYQDNINIYSNQYNNTFDSQASQTYANIDGNGQYDIKFSNYEYDRGWSTVDENGKIYINTLRTENTAPQLIGIINNELVEVDASSIGTSPIEVVNTSSLFSTALNAGVGSSAADSNFFGQEAGKDATGANNSNFMGSNAGKGATAAYYSNFFGQDAGYGATTARDSNFFGFQAGQGATGATWSNFFGHFAGKDATDATDSNFFGWAAGQGATAATQSTFIGYRAGYSATSASSSNFMGNQAGENAKNASNSNFFGSDAGYQATGATSSNFFGQFAGKNATNASYSNFMGNGAGQGAYYAGSSNFFGQGAGEDATNAADSNFFGRYAGIVATGASHSNFFGFNAGSYATAASNSNFFGHDAGAGATAATNSNFLGYAAGRYATAASNSNFMGNGAGANARIANSSNFFGLSAGYQATGASNSNFFGQNAGKNASGATNSNFLGMQAGENATIASNSNFIGPNAGYGATGASNSNFIGASAGLNAFNTENSNFFGFRAGYSATSATYSNFFGYRAGYQATNATQSNFLGNGAGYSATGASNSNFLSDGAGFGATNASYSNFFGASAGYGATGASNSNFFGHNAGLGATGAFSSNFIGYGAGYGATNANFSNFFGQNAGYGATNAYSSNFLGVGAGQGATGASSSNFMGLNAGENATDANNSNFYGRSAGYGATAATQSNFMGNGAGLNAFNAEYSNFYGNSAGQNATGAFRSNFFGFNAGSGQSGASYSNFFGPSVGSASGGVFLGSNNIIIGNNITLPQGASNSLNIGGVLFGTDFYSTFGGFPFSGASSGGRIGVAVVNPTKRLHISGETANDSGLRLESLTSASPTSVGQAIGVDSNGNVVTVSGGGGSTFTGGTVNGATTFTGGLSANTISATTVTSPSISTYGLIVATSMGYQNMF